MTHTCHAHGCSVAVPPKMLMCYPHWRKVPKQIQAAIWQEYRPGQEQDKHPSRRYLAVQQLAIGSVAFKPHDEEAARIAAPYLLKSIVYRQQAIDAGEGDPLPWAKPVAPDDVELLQRYLHARH